MSVTEMLKKIEKRLNDLEEYARDEGETINRESRRSFISFMRMFGYRLGYPDIVLSPENIIVAKWRRKLGGSCHFSLYFQEEKTVKGVII